MTNMHRVTQKEIYLIVKIENNERNVVEAWYSLEAAKNRATELLFKDGWSFLIQTITLKGGDFVIKAGEK